MGVSLQSHKEQVLNLSLRVIRATCGLFTQWPLGGLLGLGEPRFDWLSGEGSLYSIVGG